jgi:hypothetical protein
VVPEDVKALPEFAGAVCDTVVGGGTFPGFDNEPGLELDYYDNYGTVPRGVPLQLVGVYFLPQQVLGDVTLDQLNGWDAAGAVACKARQWARLTLINRRHLPALLARSHHSAGRVVGRPQPQVRPPRRHRGGQLPQRVRPRAQRARQPVWPLQHVPEVQRRAACPGVAAAAAAAPAKAEAATNVAEAAAAVAAPASGAAGAARAAHAGRVRHRPARALRRA